MDLCRISELIRQLNRARNEFITVLRGREVSSTIFLLLSLVSGYPLKQSKIIASIDLDLLDASSAIDSLRAVCVISGSDEPYILTKTNSNDISHSIKYSWSHKNMSYSQFYLSSSTPTSVFDNDKLITTTKVAPLSIRNTR